MGTNMKISSERTVVAQDQVWMDEFKLATELRFFPAA